MANNTLFRFTIRLSLESSPCTPRPDCIGYTQSGEESSLRFPAGKAGSVDDVLSLPNRVVAEGCGQLELCLGAANVEWLLSELEHNIVEKMCQVSREGINSLTAGGGKCSGGQKEIETHHQDPTGMEGKDLIYSMCLPFSNPGTPQCTSDEPLTSAFTGSFADMDDELVDESLPMTSRQGSLGVAFRPTDQELLCLLRERLESGTGHENIEDLPKTVSAIDPDSILGSTGTSSEDAPTPSSARYFFCTRARAKNGAWSRKTQSGWWDQERNPNNFAPGNDDAQKVIFNHKSKGRPWTGLKWQMHEYQLSKNEPLVLCKVMQVADRPRRKAPCGAKREPLPATNPPPKVRKLAHKRPRVPLELPTCDSTTLSTGSSPHPEKYTHPKEEALFDDEPNFAAHLFSLLAPSPRFGNGGPQWLAVPSPRADAWAVHVLNKVPGSEETVPTADALLDALKDGQVPHKEPVELSFGAIEEGQRRQEETTGESVPGDFKEGQEPVITDLLLGALNGGQKGKEEIESVRPQTAHQSESSEGSAQSDAVGTCIGCERTGQLDRNSRFCLEGPCIICGHVADTYNAATHLCGRCDTTVRCWAAGHVRQEAVEVSGV